MAMGTKGCHRFNGTGKNRGRKGGVGVTGSGGDIAKQKGELKGGQWEGVELVREMTLVSWMRARQAPRMEKGKPWLLGSLPLV